MRNGIIISLVTLILFIISFWILLENDVLNYDWYDKRQQKQAFEKALQSDVKVLIIGDSQLETWPMDHCLDKDLKQYFSEKSVGYVNLAHFGFGPLEYLNELKKTIPLYKPDYVYLFFYTGNDLSDVMFRESSIPLERTYEVVFSESDGEDTIEELESSYSEQENDKPEDPVDFAEMRQAGVDTAIIRMARNAIKNPDKFGGEFVNPHLLNTGRWKPKFHYENLSCESAESRFGWYITLELLNKIIELCDSVDAELSVVAIPSDVQIDSVNYGFYRKALFEVNDDLLYTNCSQKNLHFFCKNWSVEYLDLMPFFKSDDNPGDLFLLNDNHLSEKGHEKAFSIVKKRLLEKQMSSDARKKDYVDQKLPELDLVSSLIDWEIEKMKRDESWYSAIKQKAKENGISVEKQLYLDAIYLLKQESE